MRFAFLGVSAVAVVFLLTGGNSGLAGTVSAANDGDSPSMDRQSEINASIVGNSNSAITR